MADPGYRMCQFRNRCPGLGEMFSGLKHKGQNFAVKQKEFVNARGRRPFAYLHRDNLSESLRVSRLVNLYSWQQNGAGQASEARQATYMSRSLVNALRLDKIRDALKTLGFSNSS